PTPYDNVGSQDHNQVLGADVTHGPELTNSVRKPDGALLMRPRAQAEETVDRAGRAFGLVENALKARAARA
ncbi:hypothetical protein, partial [Streptomyces sp. NPDC001153]